MWENRIKLNYYVHHDDARIKIQEKLNELNKTDDYISRICISADGGYVFYKVYLKDDINFSISDNGHEIK